MRKFCGLLLFSLFLTGNLLGARFEWQNEIPQRLGMDSLKLATMKDSLAARGTKALLVIRRDKIALEWYAEGWDAEKPHYTASLAKALVGGMSLAIAMNDGLIGPDDKAAEYIPAWQSDPGKSKITIRQLATHSSGIEDAESMGIGHFDLKGWKLAFWKQEPDPFTPAIHDAPLLFVPGSNFHYSNTGMAALAYAVTKAISNSEDKDIHSLLRHRLMEPIGADSSGWSMGYGKTFELDGLQLCANWGGGSYTARTVARVGRLMMRKGDWDGQKILSPQIVEKVTSWAGTPKPYRGDQPFPASGLGWYTNFDSVWPEVPADAFAGLGAQSQALIVIPSLEIVAVRMGGQLDPETAKRQIWGSTEEFFFKPLVESVIEPPYPYSNKHRLKFDSFESMKIEGDNCDNWPITWAADDNMYTAYGDGWGFRNEVEKKLSNGLAKIIGGPEDFRTENLRTPSGETVGQGREGSKASGMLAVGGRLYMLMRNLDNSQLWWSDDNARTWTKGFSFETSFGCPAFLNAGKDYSAAPDDYLYIYSQDGPSAYVSYDRVVAARVHRDSVTVKEAYRYYAGNDNWSADVGEREAVFSYPNRCRRLDIVYNPYTKSYLMALGYDTTGGWGIFESETPVGPWETLFHTDYWGLGDTHGYRLPSRWLAEDGKRLYLIFSGRPFGETSYDAFCVLGASLVTP